MTFPAGVRVIFRPSRPQGATGRFYIEIKDPPPGARPLIPCVDPQTRLPLFTHRDDKAKVQHWAAQTIAPFLARALSVDLETCDAWMDRFVLSRTGKVTTVDRDHKQWLKWISPVRLSDGTTFGARAIVHITPDDIEAVRDHLDIQIDAWEAAGKRRGVGLAYHTATNVWAILTCAMRHASTRKGARDLRVREAKGNPCTDIRPPRRGRAKRRHWLRSAWLDAALAAPENDHDLKEAVAIGVGLHLRPGELHELRVSDIDIEAGEVSITRSYDEDAQKVTDTKTDEGVRTVTIPAWLMPLLERIAEERGSNDRVAPWVAATPESDRAKLFRLFLRRGGKAPESIFVDTSTHEMVDFRSIRDTGITLRFIAGERAEVVQREAGHEHIATTLGYAKEVANRGGRYGSPALTLPPDLAGKEFPEISRKTFSKYRKPFTKMVARVGFEPTTFGL